MALTKIPAHLSSTPSISDSGSSTAITIDSSGNVAIAGNLSVTGSTTTADNLTSADKNITLNYHASNDTSGSADGAGITIQDAVDASNNATLLWDASGDKFTFSHPLCVNQNAAGGYYITVARGNSTPGGTDPWLGLYNNTNIANATYGWGWYDSSSDGSLQLWNKNNSTTGYAVLSAKRGGWIGIGTTTQHAGARMQICGDDTSPDLTSTSIDDCTLILSNSDDDYGTVFATQGSGKGYIQQRRMAQATYYDLAIQPYGGKVGISTDAPSLALEINDETNVDGEQISIKGHANYGGTVVFRRGDSYNWRVGVGGASSTNSTIPSSYFGFEYGNTLAMSIAHTTGRIGIGTTNPGGKLDVHTVDTTAYSSTGEPVETALIHNESGADGTGATYYSSLGMTVGSGATSQGFINYVRTADNQGKFTFSQRTGSSSYAESMTILNNGNVGIGTSSPGAALDIETAGNTADGTYYSTITINNTGSSTYSRLRFDRSGSARWGIGLRSDDKFQIAKLWNTASDDTFVIDSSGKVGIGVSSPAATLHVETSTNSPLLVKSTYSGGGYVEYALGGNGAALGYLGSCEQIISGGSDSNLGIRAQGNLDIATGGNTQRFRFSSTGIFGVGGNPNTGLSNSAASIQIIAPTTATHDFSPTSFNAGSLLSLDANNDQNHYAAIRFTHNGNTEGFFGLVRQTSTSDITDFIWQMYDGSANAYKEIMRISEQGYPQFKSMGAGSGQNAVQWWSGGGRGGGMLIYVSSSKQYKKDITDCTIDSSKIYNLQAKSFKWNEKSVHEDKEDWGMIAEEVIEHIPELGVYRDGKVDSLQYEKLSVLLLEEIKKLNERIKVLEG